MKYLGYFFVSVIVFLAAFLTFDIALENWQKFLIVVFLGWLIFLELLERKNIGVERHSVLVLFKTERGMRLIERIAVYKRFWKAFGSLGVLVGYIGMAAFFVLIILNFYLVYLNPQTPLPEGTRGAMPLIPGVTVPLYYIIALVIVLVVHEFAHGIIAVSQGIPIKKLGLIFITIIPIGAFVEPDEEILKKKSAMTKLRVYAAGSFTNLLVALLTAIAMMALIGFFMGPLNIVDVVEGSPASQVLEPGMVIKSINGVDFSPDGNTTDLLLFSNVTKEIKPGDTVEIETDSGIFSLTSIEKEGSEKGFIGIQVGIFLSKEKQYFYSVLYSIAFLNLIIGIMNLGPILFIVAGTDGHHMLKILASRFLGETGAEKIATFISLSMMILIFYMLIVPAPNVVGG